MPPLGLAMVQIDLPGHGYSDGERAYINSYTHWLDDYLQVIFIVCIIFIKHLYVLSTICIVWIFLIVSISLIG